MKNYWGAIFIHTYPQLLITKKKTGDTAFTKSSVLSPMMGQSDIVPSDGMHCKGHVTHVLLLTKYLT